MAVFLLYLSWSLFFAKSGARVSFWLRVLHFSEKNVRNTAKSLFGEASNHQPPAQPATNHSSSSARAAGVLGSPAAPGCSPQGSRPPPSARPASSAPNVWLGRKYGLIAHLRQNTVQKIPGIQAIKKKNSRRQGPSFNKQTKTLAEQTHLHTCWSNYSGCKGKVSFRTCSIH